MHTIRIVALGFALLAGCLFVGRWLGPSQAAGYVQAAKVFIPLWAIGAGINMWVGVSKAGYSVAEETPVFLVAFTIPVAAALLVWWCYSRG